MFAKRLVKKIHWRLDTEHYWQAWLCLYVDDKFVNAIRVEDDPNAAERLTSSRLGHGIKELIKYYNPTYAIEELLSE